MRQHYDVVDNPLYRFAVTELSETGTSQLSRVVCYCAHESDAKRIKTLLQEAADARKDSHDSYYEAIVELRREQLARKGEGEE